MFVSRPISEAAPRYAAGRQTMPYSTPSATINGVRPSLGGDVELATFVEQVLNDAVRAPIRRRVHRGLTEVADRVDIRAQLVHEQPDGFQHLTLGARSWYEAQAIPAAAISGVMLFVGDNPRVGAVREQHAHDLDISRFGRQEKRGRAARCRRYLAPDHRAPPCLRAVDVRAVRQQRLDDAHPVELHRDGLVTDVPVGDSTAACSGSPTCF